MKKIISITLYLKSKLQHSDSCNNFFHNKKKLPNGIFCTDGSFSMQIKLHARQLFEHKPSGVW